MNESEPKLKDGYKAVSEQEAEQAVRVLLSYMGDDPERSELKKTPSRVIKAFKEMCAGYDQDPSDLISTFSDGSSDADVMHQLRSQHIDQIVLVKDIEFSSTCEHHLLPFRGKAHVAYIPNPSNGVIGLSKLPRLVKVFAKRLQVQEKLTKQIANQIEESGALAVGVVIHATHSCMSCRGVESINSTTITSKMSGLFRTNTDARVELMNLINQPAL